MSRLGVFIIVLSLVSTLSAIAATPRDYYPDELEGRNKGDLKTQLHQLLKEHRRIEYGSRGTWVVFRESDIREDGTVWDMYSDIDRYFPASGATKGMNIEHSVPKSWWGDDYPYTVDGSFDLHHLVPADATANSKKSNYALGEVEGNPSFDNGVSKVGKARGYSFNVFEPADEYKGDFARMYMYFVTCYQDYSWRSSAPNMFVTGDYPTLNAYSQELLLRWHREDPVSVKEINRNDAIYRFQFNRNPFIDYPQLAEYIWGDSINYLFRFDGNGGIAPSLNYKSGDEVIFNSEELGGSRTKTITLQGANITSDIRVNIADNRHFEVTPSVISAREVVSEAGAELYITFHPQDYGTSETSMVLSCDDMANDITVTLRGVCMPLNPPIVYVENMKAEYSQSDADVALALSNCNDSVVWYIDNNRLSNNIFSPSSLDVGVHTILFRTTTITGKVRVNITQ